MVILVKNHKLTNQKQIYQGKNEMSTNQGPGGSRNVFFLNSTDWQTGSFISLVHQVSNNLFCWFFFSSYSIFTITHSFQTLIGQEKWLKWWHNLSVFLSFSCTTFQETLPQKDVKNLGCSCETKDSSPPSVILQTTEMTSRHHSTWNLNILMSFLEKGQCKIFVNLLTFYKICWHCHFA